MNKLILLLAIFAVIPAFSIAQSADELTRGIEQLKNYDNELDHKIDQLAKQIDDVLWFNKVGDVAHIDKYTFMARQSGKKKIQRQKMREIR